MGFRKKAVLICVCIAVVAGVAVWALLTTAHSDTPVVQKPMPVPNGYDKILEATAAMQMKDFDPRKATPAELAGVVELNRRALQLMEEALQMESRVRLASGDDYLKDAVHIKRLATAVVAAGHHAIQEQRYADAARHFLNTIELGEKCSKGGPLISSMVGTAVSRLGVSELERLVTRLDPKTCSNTVPVLEKLIAELESSEDILQNEKAWVQQTHGNKGIVIRWVTARQRAPAEKRASAAIGDLQSRMETLIQRLHEQAKKSGQTLP